MSAVSEGLRWFGAGRRGGESVVERRPHFRAGRTKEDTHRKHHKHRIVNAAQLLVYKLAFAHLGKFIIIGVYFLLLQTLKGQHTTIFNWHVVLPDVKGTWDHLLSASTAQGGLVKLMSGHAWDSMRHVVFRGLVEGVLGIVLFKQIGFNVEKYRDKLKKKGGPGPFGRLVLKRKRFLRVEWSLNSMFASPYQDCPVTPTQYLFLPVVILLVTTILGVPLYLAVHNGLAHAAHWTWLEPRLSAHPSFWQKLYAGQEVYEGLIIGVIVGAVAGLTYRAYLFANTMNYGRTWVSKGRGPKWWMPWPTRELIRDLCTEGVARQREVLAERHNALKVLLPVLLLLMLGLAVFGYFVLQTNGFTH